MKYRDEYTKYRDNESYIIRNTRITKHTQYDIQGQRSIHNTKYRDNEAYIIRNTGITKYT